MNVWEPQFQEIRELRLHRENNYCEFAFGKAEM